MKLDSERSDFHTLYGFDSVILHCCRCGVNKPFTVAQEVEIKDDETRVHLTLRPTSAECHVRDVACPTGSDEVSV